MDYTIAYGHNRYAYCVNNPVMFVDPEGCEAIAISTGALVWGVICLVALVFGGIIEKETHVISDAIETFASAIDSFVDFIDNIVKYQPKKAAPRIKNKTKKQAWEKAFYKGGKKKPIYHKDKHGPHFHPDDPRFKHWHYFFLLMCSILAHRDEDCNCILCLMENMYG